MVCSINSHQRWISEHLTTAPGRNPALVSCEPLVTTFSLTDQHRPSFMCLLFKDTVLDTHHWFINTKHKAQAAEVMLISHRGYSMRSSYLEPWGDTSTVPLRTLFSSAKSWRKTPKKGDHHEEDPGFQSKLLTSPGNVHDNRGSSPSRVVSVFRGDASIDLGFAGGFQPVAGDMESVNHEE